eukprot:jgi/Botrbrau1/3316/Bobra.0048s0012.1
MVQDGGPRHLLQDDSAVGILPVWGAITIIALASFLLGLLLACTLYCAWKACGRGKREWNQVQHEQKGFDAMHLEQVGCVRNKPYSKISGSQGPLAVGLAHQGTVLRMEPRSKVPTAVQLSLDAWESVNLDGTPPATRVALSPISTNTENERYNWNRNVWGSPFISGPPSPRLEDVIPAVHMVQPLRRSHPGADRELPLHNELQGRRRCNLTHGLHMAGSREMSHSQVLDTLYQAEQAILMSDQGNRPSTATASCVEPHAKQKSVAVLMSAYDQDMLDPEWQAMLGLVDDGLLQAGVPEMDAKERTVAIRSLLVSTARESPERAIEKAVEDVRQFRRERHLP